MSSKSQLNIINKILNIEGMTITAYKVIDKIGYFIYLESNQSKAARLGIDEIAFVKGQKNYCAVLVDLDKKELIAILSKRTQEAIGECLKLWGEEVFSQITEVSIDLFSSDKSLINELIPNAEVVGDRFHVMKQINEELDRERVRIKRDVEKVKNKDEQKKKLAALTHSKYTLLKNEADLNELQKEKLIEIENIFPKLAAMHKTKELFRDIFESKIDWGNGLDLLLYKLN